MRDPPAVARDPTDVPPHESIFRAVARASGESPADFVRFGELACGGGLTPRFTEHSVRFGERLEPHRLTHYFDVGTSGEATLRGVIRRLEELAGAMGMRGAERWRRLSDPLSASVETIEQVVLGVDARQDESASRLKLYLVFSAPSAAAFELVRTSLGFSTPPGLAPHEVRLLGVDLLRDGTSDMKAYLRLDRDRLGRTIRARGGWNDLADGAREVVLAQGLGAEPRRQLHFHATDEATYARWLEARDSNPGVSALLAHVRACNAELGAIRLAPWIIGLPYESGHVDDTSGNVYLHPMPR